MDCKRVNENLMHNEDDLGNNCRAKSPDLSGRWQTVICAIVAISRLIGLWNVYAILFLTPKTEYRCINLKDKMTVDVLNSTCYKECLEYEYYQDVFETTTISEFGLICDNKWMSSFIQTIFMLGLMIGISIFGWFSDRFGRRIALIISCATNVIFMFQMAYVTSYWAFTVMRFFVGLSSGGVMPISVVYILETVSPQYTELAGGVTVFPDGVAICSLALFAYFASTWRIYLLIFSAASLLILLLLFFIPETPRWLVANGKSERTVEVMRKPAIFDKRSVKDIRNNVTKKILEFNLANETQKMNYKDLCKTKELTIITLCSFIIWFITGFCYYGMAQYTTLISSNIFIVVTLVGGVQMLMAFVTSVISKTIGRKASTIITYIISGLSMMCLIFIPPNTGLSTLFGIIGTVSIYLNLCVLYIYVSELYPTTMRCMGFSLSAAGSKLGGTVAPFVVNLRPYWAASVIFTLLPFIAAAVTLLLPETRGQKSRDILDEI